MSGSAIEVKIEDEALQKELKEILVRLEDPIPAMKIIGQIVRTSIVRNFEKGGRPEKWEKHGDLTKKRRGKGAAILRAEGHLMNSIKPKAYRNKVVVGTNKVYAAIHQFGAKQGAFGRTVVKIGKHSRKLKGGRIVTVKAHEKEMPVPWGDIPERPFLMVQDEDWAEIKAALNEFVILGRTT